MTKPAAPPAINIAAVERNTGLSKDTLRVWERRYGFPTPERDQHGERRYPQEQVEKLRVLKRLLDHGHRPGKIIHHSADALRELLNRIHAANAKNGTQSPAELTPYLDLITSHQIDDLRRSLSQKLLEIGLARFVSEMVGPLNTLVGEAWSQGKLEVFEEHLYTESLQIILRNTINTIPLPSSHPRVLLTTFPQEPHGLGILMAEALFALDGSWCVSLGVQTPIQDIVNAAKTQRAEIIALSFSSLMGNNQVTEGLRQLRAQLPEAVEIWVGGSHPALQHKALEKIQRLRSLNDIRTALVEWRERHAASDRVEV